MPNLTTGLLENTPVAGIRPSSTLAVNISNDDTAPAMVQIQGFHQSGMTKVLYVNELFNIPAGGVALRSYYAQFNEFEFQFTVNSDAVNITAWGKSSTGSLATAHRLVAQEVNPF
ncbi:hypothetical protein Desor_0338 [Desulfosporosinus orientis DSM 765]|uniref:Uncharacterized protein n=1 Tax=Desulfosporosinus orientis (strain ATCC 19365 / DSM 765 / NCIMB 8382 / VKM B-1628 / Singapore I) TaxID=768706 RepID=G7W535_DESOD|nr:hypothetical protein [Desulfosporosinus orientis]AET66051.1 hypothetical protein Desor_0338 [Desulfosporosinus orientis DSM 765]